MEHTEVVLGTGEHSVAQSVDVLHLLVFAKVTEAFLLDAGHVEDVGLVDGLLVEDIAFVKVQVVTITEIAVAIGHTQQVGGDEMETRVEERERLDK